MKAVVINLKSRKDRLDLFKTNNEGKAPSFNLFEAVNGKELTYEKLRELDFDTDKYWRDPNLGRVLTWGEIGCFLSHYRVWEMIANGGEPVLVIEDDAVLTRHLGEVWPHLGNYELLYLAHLEMNKKGVKSLTDHLLRPCYPYHTTAYILTPIGARKLLDTDIRHNIIPVDEYLPRMLDKLNVAGFKNQAARQISRQSLGTDVEPTSEASFVKDFQTHVLTCGSDGEKMKRLIDSGKEVGITPVNVIHGKWKGSDMKGPGGGQKLVDLKSYIERHNIPDNDVILFTDAYDVFFSSNLDTIVSRYLGYKKDIIFSAEKSLWPDKTLRFPATHTPFRYLNSGTFIGRVGEIKRMLAEPIEKHEDDQLYIQKQFLTGRFSAVLDTECYIFCTHEPSAKIENRMVHNPVTGCHGCIYHGNGGSEAKAKFDQIYKSRFPEAKYIIVKDHEVIGPEMILIDCFTEEDCKRWIEISEKHGGWNPHPADKFPSHDIHIKQLGLWDEWSDHWNRVVAPITNRYWRPAVHHHIRKAFTMKYSNDTQKTLGLHNDAALVTGSMKLNDDYTGATLVFPRQGLTNTLIPPGKLLLFPGPLTHGHHVSPLESGTKYSFTTWTARWKGDYLDP